MRMQERYLWLAMHKDQFDIRPYVFVAGEAIDKTTIVQRLRLSFQPENGQGLITLRLGELRALQDFSVPETDHDRQHQRRYRGGS